MEPSSLSRGGGASLGLGARPPASHVDPLSQAAAILAFDVDDVRVAAAAASDTVLLGRVVVVPVLVLLDAFALVERCLLEVGVAWELSGRRVGRAVLDRRMPVAKVTEVVDVARGE